MEIKEEFKLNPVVDYSKSDKPFVVCRFITECGKLVTIYEILQNHTFKFFCTNLLNFLGNKLNAKIMTTATALAFFHRYNDASPDPSYDPYVRFFLNFEQCYNI